MKTSTRFALATLMLAWLAGCAQDPLKPAPRSMRSTVTSQMPPPAATVASKAADVRTRYAAALELQRTQKWREADAAMLALTRDYPAASGPWTNLGILRARRKDWNGAILAFSSASAANPRNVTALNWLGTCLRTAGDPVRAEQAYLRALAADPRDAQTHLNLAVLYDLSLKNPQQALEHYRASQQHSRERSPILQAWIRDLEAPVQSGAMMLGSAP